MSAFQFFNSILSFCTCALFKKVLEVCGVPSIFDLNTQHKRTLSSL